MESSHADRVGRGVSAQQGQFVLTQNQSGGGRLQPWVSVLTSRVLAMVKVLINYAGVDHEQ